jgi:hypothetical protein
MEENRASNKKRLQRRQNKNKNQQGKKSGLMKNAHKL